ncbi:transposable element Tcb1 transposase [Trichonephila clavipes]|uniref:Transposable element Tcb1 transposase n=1 Tax=Trichonephila clavipes TaxID=2585209 RepID=A0A8X6WB07_TRICX|nr:transposable element Tcb1 transposase [Trichonephila clavipes]
MALRFSSSDTMMEGPTVPEKKIFFAGKSARHVSYKKQSTFDQVFEFDRGRIVAYQDCGLYFREFGSRVERNQTTLMRICDYWMQDGTTDRRSQLHPPQCTPSREDRQIVRMAVTDRSLTS